MSPRLVPKSVTLNYLERPNGGSMRYFTEFRSFPGALRKCMDADTPTLSVAEYLLRYLRRLRRTSVLCI